jgi:hypothetical protein
MQLSIRQGSSGGYESDYMNHNCMHAPDVYKRIITMRIATNSNLNMTFFLGKFKHNLAVNEPTILCHDLTRSIRHECMISIRPESTVSPIYHLPFLRKMFDYDA